MVKKVDGSLPVRTGEKIAPAVSSSSSANLKVQSVAQPAFRDLFAQLYSWYNYTPRGWNSAIRHSVQIVTLPFRVVLQPIYSLYRSVVDHFAYRDVREQYKKLQENLKKK